MLLSLVYRLLRCLFGLLTMLVRSDLSKDAELLVLRHENQVLRRQLGARLRWDHADRSPRPRSCGGTVTSSPASGTTPVGASQGDRAAALVPSLPGDLAALAVTGFFSTAFMATGNTTLQLTSDPRFRGRVMALWSVTFSGSTPIGGPVIGTVANQLSPRYALGLGAIACLAAATIGAFAVRRMPPAERHARPPASSTGTPTSKHTNPARDRRRPPRGSRICASIRRSAQYAPAVRPGSIFSRPAAGDKIRTGMHPGRAAACPLPDSPRCPDNERREMARAGFPWLQRAHRAVAAIVSQHLEKALAARFGLERTARDDGHGSEI